MTQLSRRDFLKTGTAFASLTVLVSTSPTLLAAEQPRHDGIGPCLRFTNEGNPVLCVPMPDMGQGMMTTAAQLIAEELDIELSAVSVEYMPFNGSIDANGRTIEGPISQSAGGSHSTMLLWPSLRKSAAFARAIFVEAAAQEWNVSPDGLSTRNGMVIHTATNQHLSYNNLLETAQTIELDSALVEPKALSQHKVVGRAARNVSARDIVMGKPLFGIDVNVPDMLHAVVRRCPHLKGKLVSYNKDAVEALPGVNSVIPIEQIEDNGFRILSESVAVIADTYWQARRGADALDIEWDGSLAKDDSTSTLLEKCGQLVESGELKQVALKGNPVDIIAKTDTTIDVIYSHPSWAHTCIEPHNCIAHVQGDSAEVWVGHQNMTKPANVAKTYAGVDPAKMKTHFYRMGTGFGRKSTDDYIAEAVILSKRMQAPVKVTWSREDEIEQDYPNHMGAYRVQAAVNRNGDLSAWHIRTALDTGRDWVAKEFPTNALENALGEVTIVPNHISRGPWRGPSHNTGAWVVQSALNEAAYAAGRDPLEFLVALYNKAGTVQAANWPRMEIDFRRHAALLKKAAKEADYGKKMPKGWGQGIAVHHTFVSASAHVVDLEMIGDDDYRVHKVTSAIECGLVVNPLGVRAQVESGIMDGLCAAKYGNLVFENGVPITNNFDSYQKMRIDEAPAIVDVHIMDFGDTSPRGTGEISLPPLIPALTNAIFAASGKRVRTLPISENL